MIFSSCKLLLVAVYRSDDVSFSLSLSPDWLTVFAARDKRAASIYFAFSLRQSALSPLYSPLFVLVGNFFLLCLLTYNWDAEKKCARCKCEWVCVCVCALTNLLPTGSNRFAKLIHIWLCTAWQFVVQLKMMMRRRNYKEGWLNCLIICPSFPAAVAAAVELHTAFN